jgi:hypothetical protein
MRDSRQQRAGDSLPQHPGDRWRESLRDLAVRMCPRHLEPPRRGQYSPAADTFVWEVAVICSVMDESRGLRWDPLSERQLLLLRRIGEVTTSVARWV